MKQKWLIILLGGIFSLTLLQSFKLYQLEQKIVENEVFTQLSLTQLANTIEHVSLSIQEQLQQEQSLISSYEIEYQDLDSNLKHLSLKISLQLKDYSDETKVSLQVNNDIIPLSKNQATFSGTLSFPIEAFMECYDVLVLVAENERYQTEMLPETLDLKSHYFLSPVGAFIGTRSQTLYSGELELYTDQLVPSIQFIIEQNQEILFTHTIENCYGGSLFLDERLTVHSNDQINGYAIITDRVGFEYYYLFFSDTYNEAGDLMMSMMESELLLIKGAEDQILYKTY